MIYIFIRFRNMTKFTVCQAHSKLGHISKFNKDLNQQINLIKI